MHPEASVQKGQCVNNFEILETLPLEELDARGIWARHRSGAELFHVHNRDAENLFAFAFATAPDDSTGAAHILEHSALCGSARYPLKDAFLVLAQGSLQTYLNAWTFPDKTVYPASSINERDYFNLMSVYADAVFRPLLSEWTFMQEGWRLVPGKAGLEYTGVVYNEMKGAYSSMDACAGRWSVGAVMPGTPYAFDSGGDPECIPDLSREALQEFHRSRYAPANCRIFLAGNIPTEQQTAFLDKCLEGLPAGSAAPPVQRTERWQSPRTLRIPCPGESGQKPQVMLSWLCAGPHPGDTEDLAEIMALGCLSEVLLGHDGSPLARALIESGLGEDLSPVSGLNAELREMVFCAGLRGAGAENCGAKETYRRFEELVMGELRRLVREGIPAGETEAALLSMEFAHREIRRSGGPYSLVWLRSALQGWLHGRKPWESMLFMPSFTVLKERIENGDRCLESLIEKHLLGNPHRALVIIEGEADYLAKKEAALAKKLAQTERSLGEEEKKGLAQKAAELEKIQAQRESREALASIPHLSRRDLVPALEAVPTEYGELAGGVPRMSHPLFTNGISYAALAFPADVLSPKDYPWLPFFAQALVSTGIPGMDYGEVSTLLARISGGLYASLETRSAVPAAARTAGGAAPSLLGRDWIVYQLKALDEKFASALELVLRLVTEADFSDLRRLKDLAAEMKNEGDASLAPAGHSYAAGWAARHFSRSQAVNELWNGMEQISFARRLAAMDMGELRDRMIRIRDALLAGGLALNITASAESLPAIHRTAEILGRFGPPRPASPSCCNADNFVSLLGDGSVFASPSLQIGFAGLALPAAPYASPEQAAELVFSHELSTGPLWESIRMMGGAYGAFAHPDSLEGVFSISTYRDPDPLRSAQAVPGILKKRGASVIDDDSLEKAVIGTFAGETRPRTPAGKGFAEFLRILSGVSHSHRSSRLAAVVDVSAAATGAAARRLAQAAEENRSPVIIAGIKEAERAAKKLGVDCKRLPV